ncbi:MAG TPA: phospholipase D family protein [Sandaracinaceae bacterium LLY-WYZ-13_1]|nr:phospholipase D family protein [Sandaracinaceae bacterium LLY-WYZ-13_1]
MKLSFAASSAQTLVNKDYLALTRYVLLRARERVWAQQFVTDARPSKDVEGHVRYLLHGFAEARARGVDVRILLAPIYPDLGPRYDVNEPVARFLAARGVPVRRHVGSLGRPRLHVKTILVDEELAIVGNANWTPNALGGENHERSLAVRSPDLVTTLAARFEQAWSRGADVR